MAHRLCDQVSMSKNRNLELWEKAAAQRKRCRDWLKTELCDAAMPELGVSKSAFDFGWIEAIEQTGRHDWYEPLRRRPRSKN
jgi:hypothetical protein